MISSNKQQSDNNHAGFSWKKWKKRHRILRWVPLCLVIFVIALASVLFVVTRSSFLIAVAQPILTSTSGGEVSIGRASVVGADRLVFYDIRIRIPGMQGDGGELAYLPEVRVDIDWSGLFDGEFKTRRVIAAPGARLRICEDVKHGVFNFGGLQFSESEGGSRIVIPQIEMLRTTIEVGVFDGAQYQKNGSVDLSGSLIPDQNLQGNTTPGSQWYTVSLHEIPPEKKSLEAGNSNEKPQPALAVEGRINPDTGEASARISGLSFTDTRSSLLPQRVREWWEVLQPRGSLQPIIIKTNADGRYSVDLQLDGVDWNLPVSVSSFMDPSNEANSDEELSHPLRMTDVTGSMVLNEQGAKLIGVSGVVEGVRYGLHGEFTSLSRAPGFDLTFDVNDFDISRNTNIITVLPESVQRAVSEQLFQIDRRSGIFNATVRVTRSGESPTDFNPKMTNAPDKATVDSNADDNAIQVSGRIQFHDAAGVYKAFPYQLSGLIGELEFNNNEIRIDSLAGRTETGGGIWIAGKVTQLGPDPEIDLQMYATEIPIDDRLKKAFGPRTAKQIDKFINGQAAESLREAGLIINEKDSQSIHQKIQNLKRTANQVINNNDVSDDASVVYMKDEIKQLQDKLQRIPEFHLGGLVNLISTIKRDAGPDQPLKTTTRMKLSHRNEPVGVLYSKFPYPLWFTAGELEIAWDRISIVKDIHLVGPTGGTVIISGFVDRKRTPYYHMEEQLQIHADPVPIDSFLVHALPGKSHDSPNGIAWPGRYLTAAGRTVAGLNLDGKIIVDGTITHDPKTQKADYQLQVALRDGYTKPFQFLENRPAVPKHQSERTWDWPTELPLHAVTGEISVTRQGLTINKMSGLTNNNAEFNASGGIDWAAGNTDIDLSFTAKGLSYQPSLIDLAGGVGGRKAERSMHEFQDKYDPEGVFDSTIVWKRDDEQGERISATIIPKRGSLSFSGERIASHDVRGQVLLRGGDTIFKEFSAKLLSPELPTESFGILTLNGTAIAGKNHQTKWVGSWVGGRFDAPFLPGILRNFGQPEVAKKYEQFIAHGLFDTAFGNTNMDLSTWLGGKTQINQATSQSQNVDQQSGYTNPFQLLIQPVDLQFIWGGNLYETKNYRGQALIVGDDIQFNNLMGDFQDGQFSLDGTVNFTNGLKTNLDMSLSSDAINDRARAILPEVAKMTIDALGLKVGDSLQVDHAHLDYDDPSFALRNQNNEADQQDTATTLPPASIHFTGTIGLKEAQMEVPVSISNMNGRIHLDVSRGADDDWPTSNIQADIDSMRAEGRLIKNGTMIIQSDQKRGLLQIPSIIGNCYGGLITGTATVQLPVDDQLGHYETDIKLANIRVAPFISDTKTKLEASQEILEADTTSQSKIKQNDNTGTGNIQPNDSHAEDASTINIPGTSTAHIAVSGTIGDPESKRGRGSIQVRDGELYDVPMVMWVLQLSSLAAPVATSFRDADIEFYIRGSRFVFERLELGSPTMTLLGSGTIQYPSGRLNMQFRSTSRMRAPLLSDVWEWVRDQLFSVRVTGTLDKPVTELVPFN